MAVAARFDFGNAPAPYPTILVDDGARHEAVGPTLGALRDAEADGQPTEAADGDGDDDDEDGVTFLEFSAGQFAASFAVDVQDATGGTKLDVWIDFDGDGVWNAQGEHIAEGRIVTG